MVEGLITEEELKVFYKVYKKIFEKGCPSDYGMKNERECISSSCHDCKIDSIYYYLCEIDYKFIKEIEQTNQKEN